VTKDELAAFYRRYNACCNEHRFEDLAHLTDTGTHRKAFHGVQPTGRTVGVPEFAFYRVDAGRVAEVWGSAFHVHLLEQLR
jgi:predicted ester cyclase